MDTFDANSAAAPDSGIFGLTHTEDQAKLVFVPVPWEVTTSFGGGTSNGPQAIFLASHQVDLFDYDVLKPYEAGLYWEGVDASIAALGDRAKKQALKVLATGGLSSKHPDLELALREVNLAGERLNAFVYGRTQELLKEGKIVGIVGGDHCVPYGAILATGETVPEFGILHFDAHSDTRSAYEGFTWSHASIMYNVLKNIPQVKKLVQVGIRDFCEAELDFCKSQGDRVEIFFDVALCARQFAGTPWNDLTQEILRGLPRDVWVSFDIDGLDPRLCPNTGTPVPGGLDFQQANHLLRRLVDSGRRIIGFDLSEVAPDPSGASSWDGNVGARLLYKLAAWTLASQGKAEKRAV